MTQIDPWMVTEAQDTLDRAGWSKTGDRYRTIARVIDHVRQLLRTGAPLDSATLHDGATILRAAEDHGLTVTISKLPSAAIVEHGPARYRVTPATGAAVAPSLEGTAAELVGILAALAPWLFTLQEPREPAATEPQ